MEDGFQQFYWTLGVFSHTLWNAPWCWQLHLYIHQALLMDIHCIYTEEFIEEVRAGKTLLNGKGTVLQRDPVASNDILDPDLICEFYDQHPDEFGPSEFSSMLLILILFFELAFCLIL